MKERDSNFELLRIIAMLFIVIWHISVHAQKGELESHEYITAICTTGVNIFILISGYFNIRTTWKSILTMYGTFVFYYITTIAINWYIFGEAPHIKSVLALFSPTTHSPWWFIACYIQLLLLSPLLNTILKSSNDKQYRYAICVLLLISCYSGFIFHNAVNVTGYYLFHFVTMYAIGDALNKYGIPDRLSLKSWGLLYITVTICMFTVARLGIEKNTFYNNPLLIFSSICLLCTISKMKIRNRLVNTIATFMLPVYLIQDSFLGKNIYKYLYEQGTDMNFAGSEYYCILSIYLIGLLISAVIADCIRRLILIKPIDSVSKYLNRKVDIFP